MRESPDLEVAIDARLLVPLALLGTVLGWAFVEACLWAVRLVLVASGALP